MALYIVRYETNKAYKSAAVEAESKEHAIQQVAFNDPDFTKLVHCYFAPKDEVFIFSTTNKI